MAFSVTRGPFYSVPDKLLNDNLYNRLLLTNLFSPARNSFVCNDSIGFRSAHEIRWTSAFMHFPITDSCFRCCIFKISILTICFVGSFLPAGWELWLGERNIPKALPQATLANAISVSKSISHFNPRFILRQIYLRIKIASPFQWFIKGLNCKVIDKFSIQFE